MMSEHPFLVVMGLVTLAVLVIGCVKLFSSEDIGLLLANEYRRYQAAFSRDHDLAQLNSVTASHSDNEFQSEGTNSTHEADATHQGVTEDHQQDNVLALLRDLQALLEGLTTENENLKDNIETLKNNNEFLVEIANKNIMNQPKLNETIAGYTQLIMSGPMIMGSREWANDSLQHKPLSNSDNADIIDSYTQNVA